MRIDAHQHFWYFNPVRDSWITSEMQALKRDFLPSDLYPHLKSNSITGCVAVQADQSENETNFLLSLAAKNDFIKGVVGWIDLRSNNLVERLEHYSQFELLKGFRHVVQAEAKGFLEGGSFIDGVKKLVRFNFAYDLLIYHHQLEEAISFVGKLNEIRIVVDHLAKPPIKSNDIASWKRGITELAKFENVSCKISGMVTEADWDNWHEADFHPYLDTLLESFGTKRLLYGSDWPVCLLAASYDQQLSIVENYLSKLSTPERNDIMGLNAVRIYQLKI